MMCWWNLLAKDEAAAGLEERFNRALNEAIVETITAVLGRNVAAATSYHLYAYLGLSTEDIPTHLKEFFNALNGSFGAAGAVLGRTIVRRLYEELGLTFVQKPDGSLVEYVEDAKKKFLNSEKDAK